MSETDYNERLEETSQMTVEAMDEYFDVDETTEKVVNIESGVSKTAKQVPDKYLDGTGLSEDDFVPNTDVNNVVEDVLEFIDEHGLPNPNAQREGSARANQIHDHFVDDEPLGYEYWKEIYNFHQRHRAQGNHECDESSIAESDKEEINQNEHDVCFFDNGYFSDHTWGSNAGYEQAERIVTAVEDAGVEKQWSPYVGPQDGFGWTNGEEVVYQEEPPGPVDVSNLTDEQASALEEALGQNLTNNPSSTPDNISDTSVDIDRSDVQETDYISVDGEKEGFVDVVERRGDDVYVRFESGDGMWLEEDMQVYVDDEPPERSESAGRFGEYTEKIRNSVNFEERDTWSTLTQKEIRNTMADSLTRIESEGMVENTIDGIGDIKSSPGRSYYEPDSGNISIAPNDFEKTVIHEVGHAIIDSNGFETSSFASIISMGFDRGKGIDTSIFSMTKGEVARKLEREGEISQTISEKITEKYNSDMVVSPNDLTFKPDLGFNEDTNEGLADFISTLNSTYTDVISDLQYDNDPLETITRENYESIKNEYEWTNANEFFAAIHENLQQEGINRNNIEIIYEQYPEVLDAYFDVFEPNDLQKRELNQLFKESGGSGPIESEPFPEVEQ